MSKKSNSHLWQIGGVFGLLGVSILVKQIIKSRKDETGSLEANITSFSKMSSKPSSLPKLKLSSLRNYRADNTTLCPGVYEVSEGGKRVQYFAPIEMPVGHVSLPKLFEKTSEHKKIPDFKETINPIGTQQGLIAYDENSQLENVRKIAYAIGKIPAKAMTDDTINAKNLENFVGSYNFMDFLTKVIAVEANNPYTMPSASLYDLQREQVAILWSLINRLTTGSTKLTEKSESNAISSIRNKALGYDPDEILNTNAKKMEMKSCLLPLVKAFLYGFFNDETNGATHWMHVNKNLKRLPPLYHYAFDTKQKDDPTKSFEPYQVRSANEENRYVNDCVFVKVDEIAAVKAYNEWKNSQISQAT